MREGKSVKVSTRRMILWGVTALSIVCFASIVQRADAGPHDNPATKEGAEVHLSRDLKEILNQEMNGIEGGMMKIIPAIAAGDWETIATIAKKIRNSFILKQKLTQEQLRELHNSLPPEFIEMDQSFHATAENLAHAAVNRNGELVNFYYYKLHSQCATCHSKFAARRFPGLNKVSQGEDEH